MVPIDPGVEKRLGNKKRGNRGARNTHYSNLGSAKSRKLAFKLSPKKPVDEV